MIVLVAVGALIGPSVLGLISNPLDGVGAQLLFNIGVVLILFHGGVGISLRVISRTAVGLGMLVLPGVFITAFIVSLVVAPIFGVSLLVAFMIGAVLAPIPAAVASILLAEGVEGAEIAVSLVALAVVATLLLQATTAGFVARRLGLIEEPGAEAVT